MNITQAKAELHRAPGRIKYLTGWLERRGHDEVWRESILDSFAGLAAKLEMATAVVDAELESLNETLIAHQTNGEYDLGYERGGVAAAKAIKSDIDKLLKEFTGE